MLFICPICGYEHNHSSDVSSPEQKCKKLLGAIWARVVDDDQLALNDIPVSLDSAEPVNTKSGFTAFNNLNDGQYPVALGDVPDKYEPPQGEEKKKTAKVKEASTRVVTFKLQRRANLKVKFMVKSGASLATQSLLTAFQVPVKVTHTEVTGTKPATDTTSKDGIIGFGFVSAGKYQLTPTFSGLLSTDDYEYKEDPQGVTLKPGDDKEVVFNVVQKVKLTARFVLKACGPNFTTDVPFETTPITVKAEPSGGQGSTDSKATTKDQAVLKLTPAAYTVTPDYSVLKDQPFEWKHGPQNVNVADDQTVLFDIGRKAKLKVEIVYKYDPDKHLRDKEDGIVPITLAFQGNEFKGADTLAPVDTKDGVAEFLSLSPGKYTITPDFTKLDASKFDYTSQTCQVDVFPDVDEPVIFKVEPLYQKVQFIGHTLCTIPTQVFEEDSEDQDKLEITTDSNGKKTFTLKSVDVPGPPYTKDDFKDLPCPDGAAFNTRAYFSNVGLTGATKLNLKKKTPASLGSWTLGDLHADLSDTSKVEFTNWIATFKNKPTTRMAYGAQMLKGVWKGRYHGDPDDVQDIAKRVAFVSDTLEKALAALDDEAKHPTVLKVFMVPECFFQGLYGAYLVNDASQLLTKLQDVVAPAKWKDWVFSFGTVNSVFKAQPPNGLNYTREIYEMLNHAPVIRGGSSIWGGSKDASIRRIQKVVNSAELADDLIEDNRALRRQAINAEVQFTDTENDGKVVGQLLMRILNDETNAGNFFINDKGLPASWWPNLTTSLRAILGNWGLPRVTQEIRVANNAAVDSKALPDWMWVVSEPSVRRDSKAIPQKDAVLFVIEQQWKTTYKTVPFEENWPDDDPARRTAVMDALISDIDTPANACGFVLNYQKAPIKLEIQRLKGDDRAAKIYLPVPMAPRNWKPAIFPIWKKLLELYNVYVAANAPIEVVKERLTLDGYCFAGPRKVAPWFASLNDTKSKDARKVMVFGVEICADHAADRLLAINSGGNAVGIDIQLVPSAGMRPKYFAVREGGYLFNCDGWNKKPENGGAAIEVHFEGPSPYNTDAGCAIEVSPVYPHTAVAKRAQGAGTAAADCLVPAVKKVVDASLIQGIFECGEGELHVYPLQDLPK